MALSKVSDRDNMKIAEPASSQCRGLSSLRGFRFQVARSGCSSPGSARFSRSSVAAANCVGLRFPKSNDGAREGVNMEIAQ